MFGILSKTKEKVKKMKLDMVGIIVTNMQEASLFYQRLGFTLIGDPTGDYLELENDGVRISLNTQTMIEGIYGFVPEKHGDKIELAFLCETPEEVDETCDKMADFGYQIYKEPWNAFWGQRYAIIKDLDNNLLSLFANLPAA